MIKHNGMGAQIRLNNLEKYRWPGETGFVGGRSSGTHGRASWRPGSYVHKRRAIYQDDVAAAMRFAQADSNVEFRFTGSQAPGTVAGYLYEIRNKHQGHYEDVEDGFTERRDNYDEATVTTQELAERVKTLLRDLKRAGLI